jgi:hypothetical protein
MQRKDIFETIYKNGVWNDNRKDIPASGPGSSLVQSKAFCCLLDSIQVDCNIQTIVDIGCGDLTWMPTTKAFNLCKYIGIDIVDSLIQSHKKHYPQHKFYTLDAVSDELPCGDIVIIRDVLFHLSISDIQTVLAKIRGKYKYYLLTSCTNSVNTDIMDRYNYHPINLTIAPFNLTNSLYILEDPIFNKNILFMHTV